ncbi:MAG: hypothetical protein F7C32_03530 [Desulfurococcales archaeon]|nr:hypothetical protein [Desulfurococcales archaeon]
MSSAEYIAEVKDKIRPLLQELGLKILPKGASSFSIVKGTQIVMTIRDTGDYVELSYQGKKYQYDKWYTKPQHLAKVVENVLKAPSA